MGTHAETIAKPAVAPPLSELTSGLLQRKCACGGSSGLIGGCAECDKQRLGRPQNADTHPSSLKTHSEGDDLLRLVGARHLGHDFSQVRVLGAAAVQMQGDGPIEKGKADPTPKPDEGKDEKKPAEAKTPDGISLGPTDPKKKFCLKSNSFNVATAVYKNTANAAQGSQIIKFEGLNTGTQDKKDCSCDCGVYRHWISGFMQAYGPDQLSKATAELVEERKKAGTPGLPTPKEAKDRAIATAPKISDIQSCNHPLTIQEGAFTEEYTACIGDNDADKCKWNYGDGPGATATSGLRDGVYIHVKHPFKYEIWDSCQGKSVQTKQATVEIEGDKSPRTITWT